MTIREFRPGGGRAPPAQSRSTLSSRPGKRASRSARRSVWYLRVPSTSALTTPGLAQHLEVVRTRRLGDRDRDLVARDRAVGRGEDAHDLQADGIAEGLEHLDEVELAPGRPRELLHAVDHAAPSTASSRLLGRDHRVGLRRRLRAQQPRDEPRRHDHDDRAAPTGWR